MTTGRPHRTFKRRKHHAPSTDGEIPLKTFPQPARRGHSIFTGYPAPYSIAMSNLGFHFLYGQVARSGQFRVERFFSDTSPYTLESGSDLSSAFALLFSVSYEEDYINLVRMLIDGGIEPDREKREGSPLIIAGGPAVSSNPFPLSGIVDVAALGEGEETTEILMQSLARGDENDPRAILEDLRGVAGFFVCGDEPEGDVSYRIGAQRETFPHSVILTGNTVFPMTMLIETGRGCPGACAFCLATALYRPFRAASKDHIRSVVEDALTTPERVGLISTAVTSHPDFLEIMRYFREKGIQAGLSSINASGLDEEKVTAIRNAGIRSVSLAPETGDETLRAKLGKMTPDDAFVEGTALLAGRGIDRLGLYFMTGLPGEDETTFTATRTFLERIAAAGKGMRISVHINVMVPKPWTPMQFFAMPDEKELEARIKGLSDAAGAAGIRVQVKPVRNSIRQAQLSLGGRGVGRALIEYAGGRISWKKAFAATGETSDLLHRERGIEDRPPWFGIKGPADHDSLLARYRKVAR